MAIQFAGSNSTGDRRRRRIVVNGEGTSVDASVRDSEKAEIESQLVASAAAGPWVPVSESRIWAYSGIIGLLLTVMTFAWAQPTSVHASIKPLSNHLLTGPQPILVTCVEFLFLTLSAQLSYLIGWYRSRGKLDFSGRYRFWPWATALFTLFALGVSTSFHRALGGIVDDAELLTWRSETVAWMLPICLAALPIALFLDRDIRNSRSSLWTVRLSVLLWITEAWLELYRPELQSQPWFESAFLLTPLFASSALFVGLWLHARIVAYVCPDPPELNEQSAWSALLAACCFTAGLLTFWRSKSKAEVDEDEAAKPKRRRKKTDATDATEDVTAKRKRKAPAKRTTTRTRTQTKSTDDETTEEQSDVATGDETESADDLSSNSNSNWDENEDRQSSEQWEEAVEEPVEPEPKGNGRFTQVHKAHNSPVSGPHSRRQAPSWEAEADSTTESYSDNTHQSSSDDNDDDAQLENDSGLTADQMKGLSKRQKRELKRQLREQERARNR